MDYLHINADCANGYCEPVVMKVSKKAWDLSGRMGALVVQHRRLEEKLIKELARINDMTTDEVSDIMSTYDFMVDCSQYGVGVETSEEISKEKYEELRKVGIEAGSMEVLNER